MEIAIRDRAEEMRQTRVFKEDMLEVRSQAAFQSTQEIVFLTGLPGEGLPLSQ